MSKPGQYRSIASISRGEFRDRGSKFIAFAYPVSTGDEVQSILSELKKEYHDARHYCYAFCLDPEKEITRSNDDGEPSGSAGNPILTQIEVRKLTNILVVVIRYFGGTLLGIGGLINAYKQAASDALEHARIITQVIKERYILRFDYAQMNAVMSLVKKEEDSDVISRTHELQCTMVIAIPKGKVKEFLNRCRRIENLKVTRD